MIYLLILLILIILLEVWTLLLRCRRGHPAWEELRLFRYAHRGFHDQAAGIPENSLPAFRRAVDNAYGAELDVHLTRDGRLAVIHDASLKRTAGADVLVEDLTAEELARYRLEGTEEKIPFLEDVLAIFAGRTPLVVEIKAERGNHAALTKATCEMLDRFPVRYCVESFDPRVLMWLKKNRPDIVRGQLAERFLRHGDGGQQSRATLFVLEHLLMNFLTQPDFIAYRFSDRNTLNLLWCKAFYHVQEINWTIDTKEDMRRAEEEGHLVIFERFDPRK